MTSPPLNASLVEMGPYASKGISQAAKADPSVVNLSIGEPAFGPPEGLLPSIAEEDLSLAAFLASVKSYETTRGALRLRVAIADWYRRRDGLEIDPEREILVTHGGVEALSLALLACTTPGDGVAVSDPSYMLYDRALRTLGRRPIRFSRPPAEQEYRSLAEADSGLRKSLAGARALVINSPENPTGYVLDSAEWPLLLDAVAGANAWLIHDEVYDSMAYGRRHFPARAFDPLGERTLLVNSFSKKFGMPGLRIGWLIGRPAVIEQACKAHDYLLLGVNRQYEQIAARVLEYSALDGWLDSQRARIAERVRRAMEVLTTEAGFHWNRMPMGGMFLFPDVSGLQTRCAPGTPGATAGERVAHHLLHAVRLATVPGIVYGDQVANHLRMVLCSDDTSFDEALRRLAQPGSHQ